MRFIDEAVIEISSGDGGNGCLSFRREKFIPKGGPDGGDGGKGGNINFIANESLHTLQDFKLKRKYKAQNGRQGKGKNMHGKDGEDTILEVPLGTILINDETDELLCDLTKSNQIYTAVTGGKGGLGNARFKTSTNRAPRKTTEGKLGEIVKIRLELKVLADVGLVGFPNAGKSTLLSVVSAAKPEIANYPFTTLVPNLGIVSYRDHKSFIMADIPGIIEGAAEGRGLGLRFLRHIERNSTLLFMVPTDSDNIKKEYEILLGELEKYNPELLDKDRMLAISKSDMLDEELKEEMKAELEEKIKKNQCARLSEKKRDTTKEK